MNRITEGVTLKNVNNIYIYCIFYCSRLIKNSIFAADTIQQHHTTQGTYPLVWSYYQDVANGRKGGGA